MILRRNAGIFLAVLLLGQNAPLYEGVTAMNQGKYDEAIAALRRAIEADARDVQARLYLGAVYLRRAPQPNAPEFADAARLATAEFNGVLGVDPNNRTALESLARLSSVQAQFSGTESEK